MDEFIWILNLKRGKLVVDINWPEQHVARPPCQGAACSLSQAELDSLLSCIKDLLPDLGDGFLLACLQEYDYNTELVINNILEDRLAPNLDKLDRAMPR